MKCNACQKDHAKKDVLFTEDRLPYCVNPFTCNDAHPNSVKNIVARGGAVQMFTEDELDKNIFETMEVPEDVRERVIKLVAKPQSIRLSKYDIALYLLQLQESKAVESIGEAVRHCIQVAMQYEPIDGAILSLPVPDPEPEPEQVPENHPVLKLNGEKIVIPMEKPSINVDWDEIDRQRKAEAERDPITNPEPIEEDEFTF
jgi:hypothetical protein